MTSHITVSSGSAAQSSTALSSGTKSTSSGPLGAFSAILDALAGASSGTQTTATTATTGFIQGTAASSSSTPSDSTGTGSILDLIEKLLGSTSSATAADTTTAAAATATDAGTPPKLLKDALNLLKHLSDAEQSGQPVDQDLLKKAKKAIDALQAYLTAQQPVATTDTTAAGGDASTAATGVGASNTATASGATTDGTNAGTARAAQLETARASLNVLANKLAQLSTATTKLDPDLSAKLDTLAKSFDPTKLTADTLDQLGLTNSTAASDPKLATAISGLANGKAQSATTVDLPLAAPQLKLPDGTALSVTPDGKTKSNGLDQRPAAVTPANTTGTTPKPTIATAMSESGNDPNGNGRGQDKSAAAVAAQAAATTGTPADPSITTDANSAAAAAAAVTGATNTPATTARLAQTAYQASSTSQVNLAAMAYEVVRNVQQGTNHFQIKLDPTDLGRVDVNLAIDSTGTVNARLTVERPETLDLLRRDAPQLGQALTQAGLDSSKTNLQFSLNQNPFTRQDNGSGTSGSSYAPPGEDDGTVASLDSTATVGVYRGTASAGGLNLFV
ncbi:MAG: flagellar hook-length control protein FliK [Devosia sp.]|nr:flagellar hook-length control protein FliK [Devosia sp.]